MDGRNKMNEEMRENVRKAREGLQAALEIIKILIFTGFTEEEARNMLIQLLTVWNGEN